MNAQYPSPPAAPVKRFVCSVALAGALAVSGAPAFAAQTCGNTCESHCGYEPCGTPAWPAPQSYWGQLQPVDTACTPLPGTRDSSWFDEFVDPYPTTNFWSDISIQNNYAFLSTGYGLQIWSLANPASPALLSSVPFTGFPYLQQTTRGEFYTPIQNVATLPGLDTVAAVSAVYGDVGVAVINTSNKAMPKVVYQGQVNTLGDIYAATLGGAHYLFVAAKSNPSGLLVLNIDRALTFNGCLEDLNSSNRLCPGVLGASIVPYATHVAGVGNLVAATLSSGVQIYDVTNPASPQLRVSALSGTPVGAIAMWTAGGQTYLGTRVANSGSVSDTLSIYNVGCAMTNTCGGGSGTLLSQTVFQEQAPETMYLVPSSSSGTPFLYLGRDSSCPPFGSQEEWLLNVTNPAVPVDITPATGYWGWYYNSATTGFNHFAPHSGRFNGSYFYRAAFSLFDIHQWVGTTPPAAAFAFSPAPPNAIYPGMQVTFDSSASTGGQLTYGWTFAPQVLSNAHQSILDDPAVTFPLPPPPPPL